jgi:predicted nucleic acid-binding protein
MILTDTTVVIVCYRAPTARLLQMIQDNDAAICGVTVAEVYAGARSVADFAHCTATLAVFGQISIPETLWPMLGQNLFALRTRGISVPFSDALIATVAIENDVELWTYDAHFALIQTALPRLKLFQEPP